MPTLLSLFFALDLLAFSPSVAQNRTHFFSERLPLDFPLLDAPYFRAAAEMAYNKRHGLLSGAEVTPTFGDYLRSYESPSMTQSVAITKNLHATNYYFNNKLWNRMIVPTNRKARILNRLAANATAAGIDLLLAYKLMVFSPVWNHEEFHRTGLALQGISSFDDTYYRLVGGDIPSGSVTRVRDADMERFKAVAPQALVRSFSAGIESQYQLLRNMQKDNFFLQADYANLAMTILVTKQAVDYVNQFRQSDYDRSIDTMNYYGETETERDFVGWDFTPWVYDLFRPNEPYAARGTHPSGTGIDRVIKRSKLTAEEDAYLTRMGRWQYLNFITPFVVGINRIRIDDNNSFNFALRHYPTSFGYNLNADIFLERNGKSWLIGLHSFHNYGNVYPGFEVQRRFTWLGKQKKEIPLHARVMTWVQPENESFYATKGKVGGLLQIKAFYPISDKFSFYAEGEGKTNGWVAGNPFLKSNFSFRAGIYLDIKQKVETAVGTRGKLVRK